jgi:alanine racemase
MMNRAWMEVDVGAVVRNATALESRAGVPIIPMIKADAYGLGAVEIARALEAVEPLAYGVATVAEGEDLRTAGIARQILIFTPLLRAEFEAAHRSNLTPTLGSRAEIEAWSRIGGPYTLSIDTGMARAGIPWREVGSIAGFLRSMPPAGAFTHFHSPALHAPMLEQESRFREALSHLPAVPPILHCDSSSAIVRHERSLWNAVRPGIFLYGVGSGSDAALQPESVVSVKARITELRSIETGDTVSYEATWTADSPRTIATIPLGYADGYPRGASNAGVGMLRNSVVPIAGRVTMDMIMLDVTGTGATVGDTVTMIGDAASAGAPIDVASVASAASISPYELLTGLRGRLRRVYTGKEQ